MHVWFKSKENKAVDVCMLPSSGDASGLPCLVFSFGCNLLCDHRKEGVDELQGLYHPQPQPQAHGAPHLREEAGQAELHELSPCHHHLAGEAEKKGGIVTVASSVKDMFCFRVCCSAGQGTVRELAAVHQIFKVHQRAVT